MTTTIDAPATGKRSFDPLDDNVHPALGETWGSICTHRIRLYDRGGHGQQRYARMFKSPTMQEQTVAFHIGPEGISDVLDPEPVKVEGAGVRVGQEDDDMDFGHTSSQSMFFWEDDDFS